MNTKVLITGPTSGTGKYLAFKLSSLGYELVLLGRNPAKLEQLQSLLQSTSSSYQADLSSIEQVTEAIRSIKAEHQQIDILINNAGILGNDSVSTTAEGLEQTFVTNYLSHYLISSELISNLKNSKNPIIYNISSQAYNWFDLDFNDIQTFKQYQPMKAYARSKLMLLMLGKWIAQNSSDIRVYNIDPGTFRSGISRSRGFWFRAMYQIAKGFMKTPENACKDVIETLADDNLYSENGIFLKKGRVVEVEFNEQDFAQLIEQSVNLTESDIRINKSS